VFIILLIGAMIIDISVLKVNDLISKSFIHHHTKLLLFSSNTIFILAIVFFIINYLERSFKKNPLNRKFNIELLYRFSLNSLFVIGTLIALLIFQIAENNYYNISISLFIVTVSYLTAAAFLVKLIQLIISWVRSNPNFLLSLLAISMILITFNLVITAIVTDLKLADRSDEIREYAGGAANISAGKNMLLNNIRIVSSIASFVSIWITTIILINYYRERSVSKFTYWFVLTLPLLYYLINYLYPFIFTNLFQEYLSSNPVTVSIIFTIVFSLSTPIGGLMFALAFWKMSKNLSYEKNIKTHMIVCGWGILLIFSADQSGLQTLAPYPPFGLATLSVLILGSFMMLVSIYNSALLVGSNMKLRGIIRQHALESNVFGVVGRSQMQKEVEKTVKKITRIKAELERDSEQRIEFDEEGLKEYLSSLMTEIQKQKNNKASDT
jgi:hypothetical protein